MGKKPPQKSDKNGKSVTLNDAQLEKLTVDEIYDILVKAGFNLNEGVDIKRNIREHSTTYSQGKKP